MKGAGKLSLNLSFGSHCIDHEVLRLALCHNFTHHTRYSADNHERNHIAWQRSTRCQKYSWAAVHRDVKSLLGGEHAEACTVVNNLPVAPTQESLMYGLSLLPSSLFQKRFINLFCGPGCEPMHAPSTIAP